MTQRGGDGGRELTCCACGVREVEEIGELCGVCSDKL